MCFNDGLEIRVLSTTQNQSSNYPSSIEYILPFSSVNNMKGQCLGNSVIGKWMFEPLKKCTHYGNDHSCECAEQGIIICTQYKQLYWSTHCKMEDSDKSRGKVLKAPNYAAAFRSILLCSTVSRWSFTFPVRVPYPTWVVGRNELFDVKARKKRFWQV